MIELRSSELALAIDPSHGAEILELRDLRSGEQVLGLSPPSARPPVRGDLDERTWTGSYRGGWQVLAPNAGNACTVNGVRHGFHGSASVERWELLTKGASDASMRWRGHGLELNRCVSVDGAAVTVSLEWTAVLEPTPLIVVEHIAFGRYLLDPDCGLEADAVAYESSETRGPVTAPASAPRWPMFLGLDGSVEQARDFAIGRPSARFAALAKWRSGQATLRNRTRGRCVRLLWDESKLPSAWLWEEIRSTGPVWRRRAELLGFEPAVTPHALGLAEAVRNGQAIWARSGVRDGYRLTLIVEPPV